MKICCSIAPATVDDARTLLSALHRNVDIVEIRIDGMKSVSFDRLLLKPRPNVIVTNRRSTEGGKFNGPMTEQIETLCEAGRQGAEYVDLEGSWGLPAFRKLQARCDGTKIIASYHDFKETPKNLL